MEITPEMARAELAKREIARRQSEKNESLEPEGRGLVGHSLDYLLGLGIGGAQTLSDIGANIAQAPSDLYTYLTGKEGYQAPRTDFNRYTPNSISGFVGENIGGFAAPFVLPVVGAETAAAKISNPILKNLTRFGTGAAVGALESENRPVGAAVGLLGSSIAPAIKGATNAVNWFTKPSKSLSQLKEYEKKLINSMQTRAENTGKFEQESIKEARDIFPEKQFAETSKNLSLSLGKSKKELNDFFEKSYGEYSHGTIGKKPISKPYELDELHTELSNISGVPRSTSREAAKISPKIEFSEILDESGKPFAIQVPSKNSSVSDYIRFMRETRDASNLAFKKAKSQNLTQSEKERLLDTGRKLQKISGDTSKRVEGSISSEESKKFSDINDLYGSVGVPLKYNPTFAKAFKSDKKLGKIGSNFYKELLQPENEALRNHLFKSKDFKKSLLEHITEGKKNPLSAPGFEKNINAIETTLKDKIMSGLMTKQEKEKLQSVVNMARHQKSITNQMQEEAAKLGVSRKELEDLVSNRKRSAAGILAGGLSAEALRYTLNKVFNKHND